MKTLILISALVIGESPPSYKNKAATARWMVENNTVSQDHIQRTVSFLVGVFGNYLHRW